jgi:hypothetical protein
MEVMLAMKGLIVVEVMVAMQVMAVMDECSQAKVILLNSWLLFVISRQFGFLNF